MSDDRFTEQETNKPDKEHNETSSQDEEIDVNKEVPLDELMSRIRRRWEKSIGIK